MKIIYLDQNKWIELNGAYHRTKTRPELDRTLEFIRAALLNRTIAVPLSSVHYVEIARIGDRVRRARLGETMWDLSGGFTLASFGRVVEHEIEQALARRFTGVTPGPFNLLGRGYAHAFGIDRAFRCTDEFRSQFASSFVEVVEGTAQSMIERAMLTGDGPRPGLEMPRFTNQTHKQRFKEHLERLRPTISELTQGQWDDALRFIELADIENYINVVLQRHNLPGSALTSLGKDALSAFLDELPTRRVDFHLHRHTLRNKHAKPHINDLEDWSALGLASAYCDVVVCEKQFASLVQRNAFRSKAQILTDLTALPELPISL